MSPRRPSPVWLFAALALAACESDSSSNEPNDPPGPSDACQAGPGELPRPPSGGLPCELLPPGFQAAN